MTRLKPTKQPDLALGSLPCEKIMKAFKLNAKASLTDLATTKLYEQNMNAHELSFKLGHNEYSDLVWHIHFHFEPN